MWSLSSVTEDKGLDDAADEFLLLDARSVEQPESFKVNKSCSELHIQITNNN